MSVVGNPNLKYGGLHLGAGANGPVALFFGVGDPNTIVDTSVDRVTVPNSNIGSLFLRTDAPDSTHALYVKTGPSTWTAK